MGGHGLAAELGSSELGYTALGRMRPRVTDKLVDIELDPRHRALPCHFLTESICFRGMRQR